MNRRDFLRGMGLGVAALTTSGFPNSLLARPTQADSIEGLKVNYEQGSLAITYMGTELGSTVTFDLADNTVSLTDKEEKAIGKSIPIIDGYEDELITSTSIDISGKTNTKLILGTLPETEISAKGLLFATYMEIKYEGDSNYADEITHEVVFNSYIDRTPIALQPKNAGNLDAKLILTFAISTLENMFIRSTASSGGVLIIQNNLPAVSIQLPVSGFRIFDPSSESEPIDVADLLEEEVKYPLNTNALVKVLSLISNNLDAVSTKLKAEATPSA